MRFLQHYSSSKGNLYEVVASNGKRLLLDPGVTWKKIQKALDYDLSNIEACFCSHGHITDHAKALKDCINNGIDCYANAETYQACGIEVGVKNYGRNHTIEDETLVRLSSFYVLAFDVEHDVPSLGFIVYEKATGERLFFAIDTSNITYKFKYPFSIIAIECSFDKDILQRRVDKGDIDESAAKRLLVSHLEVQNTKRYLKEFCDLSKCREIHLLHCSKGNLDIAKTKAEFEAEFMRPVIVCGE